MIATLFRCLLLLQYPQFTGPLNLMRVFCVFLALGKLGYGVVFSSFDERRPALVFQSSKVPSKGDSLMSCCSSFLTIGTEMLAFVFDNWLEICFFMVPSIQVAHFLVYCVLIGSLAELYLALCMRNVLACCRWLKLSPARWYHQWLLSWL